MLASASAATRPIAAHSFFLDFNLLRTSIFDVLPLAIVLDIKDPHVVPKLQARDCMSHERQSPLIFRVIQSILGVDLVLCLRAAELGEEVLLFDAAFGDLNADQADLIAALG